MSLEDQRKFFENLNRDENSSAVKKNIIQLAKDYRTTLNGGLSYANKHDL